MKPTFTPSSASMLRVGTKSVATPKAAAPTVTGSFARVFAESRRAAPADGSHSHAATRRARTDASPCPPDHTSSRERDADLREELDRLRFGSLAPAEICRAPVSVAHAFDFSVAQPRVVVEQLLSVVVRRIAWSSDGKRGAVRLELGVGELDGVSVVIESDGVEACVTIDGAPPDREGRLRARVAERLGARGITVRFG